MQLTIKDTITLEAILMKKFCENDNDAKIIQHLCFARNVAEKVAEHYHNTKDKQDFYRSILNDKSLGFSLGYQTLKEMYPNLIDDIKSN